VKNLTINTPDLNLAPQPERHGREWEWTEGEVDLRAVTTTRPRRRWDAPLAIVAASALALVGMAAFDAGESQVVPALQPVAEPAVAAADLPLGAMYHVVDQVGARSLWNQGFTGDGVNVAVIDTGIAPVESLSGPGKVVAAVDFSDDAADPASAFVDKNGHGTFVAGVIAGSEPSADPALAAEHPEWFLGVAPDAGIVSVKVDDGIEGVDQADVISGINWVVEHADSLDVGVINLSYSSASPLGYESDPLTAALERAWNAGIVVTVAAGNEGANAGGLVAPANDPFVIAVAGADVTNDGIAIADWSSSGDGVRNPDVAAPGAHLQSLRAPGSDADVNHPEGFVDDETFRGSGSSHASAVTAGVVALLLEAHPDWTPDQVKAALSRSAEPIVGADAQRAGGGFVQADRAVSTSVTDAVQVFAPATSTVDVPSSVGVSTIWSGASWVGASWVDASWVGASWVGASWVGASWVGASWVGASWVGASWVGASWVGASWVGASWVGASWVGASWVGASWVGASWVGASWVGASWVGASWVGASWVGASWVGASWVGASWVGASWVGASWVGASWVGASWVGASWVGASWV
jgi:serine protease AprX